MSITLTVVMVSQVYTYDQTHQIKHSKCVQLFVYQLHFNKTVKKKKQQKTSTNEPEFVSNF